MKILVAYATQVGSTAGIADAVGDALRGSGMAVDVRRVQDVQGIARARQRKVRLLNKRTELPRIP